MTIYRNLKKPLRMDPKEWNHIQQTPAFPFEKNSEKIIRKYYPKGSKVFWKGLLHKYQAPDADETSNPNPQALMRYKRDFFNSFSANWKDQGIEPAKLPHNAKYLNIHNGSKILLRRLFKQNKALKHIEFASLSEKLFSVLVESVKYCKNLFSITFSRSFHFISEKTLNSMRRSFGNTLQKVVISGKIDNTYSQKPEEFKRVMGSILQFPKLREIEFGTNKETVSEHFPVSKLQELQDRNIACNLKLKLARNISEAFLEGFPGVKPNDSVRINMEGSEDRLRAGWDNNAFEKKKVQVRNFDVSALENFRLSTLLQRFRETSNLELILSTMKANKTDYSGLKQLSNLKRLSINVEKTGDESNWGSLFLELSDAVDAHKKLEELRMRVSVDEDVAIDHDDSIALFFENCAKTLKKAYFEFQYSSEDFKELKAFYQGMGKLENLRSLNLLLSFDYSGFDDKAEELSNIMSKMKFLEEADLEIRQSRGKPINLIFPSWLKKLALAMPTKDVPFDPSKTLWSLSNLTWLKLEFYHFNSLEWSKVLKDIDQLQKLEVLVLKERFGMSGANVYIPQMSKNLDDLMKRCLNLKLIVFGSLFSLEVTLFRRSGYPWQEVNSIVAEFSHLDHTKVGKIYRY